MRARPRQSSVPEASSTRASTFDGGGNGGTAAGWLATASGGAATWTLLAVLPAAELRVSGVFTDHTVLQRDVAVPVWGWAEPGEQVTVEFAGQRQSATADGTGNWLVRVDPMPASAEPGVLKAAAEDRSVTCADVLVGDVWLCSGQSNMGIPMAIPGNASLQQRLAKANNPHLRLFATLHQFPDEPAADTRGRWTLATPRVGGPHCRRFVPIV